jgi:hypothetical protein
MCFYLVYKRTRFLNILFLYIHCIMSSILTLYSTSHWILSTFINLPHSRKCFYLFVPLSVISYQKYCSCITTKYKIFNISINLNYLLIYQLLINNEFWSVGGKPEHVGSDISPSHYKHDSTHQRIYDASSGFLALIKIRWGKLRFPICHWRPKYYGWFLIAHSAFALDSGFGSAGHFIWSLEVKRQ